MHLCTGLPAGVSLIPDSPGIGSTILIAPNITAKNAYLCPRGSYLKRLIVHNATIGSAITLAQNVVISLYGNCSDGSNLPAFLEIFGSESTDTYNQMCIPLGFLDGTVQSLYDIGDIPGKDLNASIPYR